MINKILTKSHLGIELLYFLFILVFFNLLYFSQVLANSDDNSLSLIVEPMKPKQGETLSIKIKKSNDICRSPRVFFDKTKYFVFDVENNFYRTFIPLTASIKTGNHNLEVYYNGMSSKVNINVQPSTYKIENITFTKEVAGLMASSTELMSINYALGLRSNKKLWSGKFLYPSSAKQSTPYGVKRRVNGTLNPEYFHKGLDFAGKTGSDVIAPEDGIVSVTGYNSKGFNVNGNCIFLDHGHGIVSAYLHLSSILVKEGEYVKKGQLIGKVGSTGIATGPHLHWGIYVQGKPVEPLFWTSMVVE